MTNQSTQPATDALSVLVRDERPRRSVTPALLVAGVVVLVLMAGVIYLGKTYIDDRNDAHAKRALGRDAMDVVLNIEAHRIDTGALPDNVTSDGGEPPLFVFIEGDETEALILHDSRIESYETTGDDYRLCLSGERGSWGLFDSADGTGKVQTGLSGSCPA